MGRKFDLIKESDTVLAQLRRGSPNTQRKRKREIRQFINELIRLGIAPPKLSGINQAHIESIVTHWKARSLSITTIIPKLSVLRQFFSLASPKLEIPNNKTLKLSRNLKAPSSLLIQDLEIALKQVETRLTHSIIAFQLYFGLTKMESIRINLKYARREDYLLIDRELATNGKDRYIPTLTLQQEKALEERLKLLDGKETLGKLLPEADTVALYKAEKGR